MARSARVLPVLLLSQAVSAMFPQAQNISWKSTNFKTVLTWEPKPSADYSYTVEFSVVGGDKQRNHHCVRSSSTTCDLSMSLTNLDGCYTADVLSEPPLGVTSDLTEFPHSSSPRFCPATQTDIGRPEFKIKEHEDKKSVTLYVSDPLTALFKDGRQQNIRDILSDKLYYKVTYRKNKSSGKKVLDSKSSNIELTDLDPEDGYCFSVQAFVPSRAAKQLGEMSQTVCSNNTNQSIINDYSPGVIAGSILLVVVAISIIIAVIVVCCRRRRKGPKNRRVRT
uniref:Tissue factor n=1 Tax=Iconisemion striatum TaxID=60296 RepID=A0A1A7YBF4_9TELE